MDNAVQSLPEMRCRNHHDRCRLWGFCSIISLLHVKQGSAFVAQEQSHNRQPPYRRWQAFFLQWWGCRMLQETQSSCSSLRCHHQDGELEQAIAGEDLLQFFDFQYCHSPDLRHQAISGSDRSGACSFTQVSIPGY